MPIQYHGKKYEDFDEAVKAVQKRKKISKEKARSYVAVVDCLQNYNKGSQTHKKRCKTILKNRR